MIKKSKGSLEARLHFYIVERDDQIRVEESELSQVGNFFEAMMSGSAHMNQKLSISWAEITPSAHELFPTVQVMKLVFLAPQKR